MEKQLILPVTGVLVGVISDSEASLSWMSACCVDWSASACPVAVLLSSGAGEELSDCPVAELISSGGGEELYGCPV